MDTQPQYPTLAEWGALQQRILNLNAAADADAIIELILRRATEWLHAKGGSIFLWDCATQVLDNRYCFNLDTAYASLRLSPGEGFAGQVAQSQKTTTASAHEFSTPETRDFGAMVAAPLHWDDALQGVLEIVRPADGAPFTADELALVDMLANFVALTLKNARLLDVTRAKTTQLETINEVNRAINATLNADRVLELILQKAVDILQTEAGSIFLVDETAAHLIFSVAFGPSGMQLVGKRMAIDETSIAGTCAARGESLIINNVVHDSRWNTTFDAVTDFSTRDILTVPMVAFDKVVGVIEVINKKNHTPFSANDEQVLTMFARQAAIALVNAQRFTQIDRALTDRVRELTTLELVDRDLNAKLNLQQVLWVTLSSAIDFLGASVGVIALMNPEKTGLHFAETVGVAKKYLRYAEDPWAVGQGIIGQVAATGLPHIAENDAIDNFAADGRSRSQLCVPFLENEAVIGVLSLESAHPHAFSADDRAFAVRYASHAVLAIQNAKLFEAAKAANEAKSEFMNMTSHELKIPMTSIKGYIKLLAMVGKDNLTAEQMEFIDVINDNVDRMNHLVMELLDVSRIEAGSIRLKMEKVLLANVVQDVLQSLRTQIEEKHLQLQVDVSPTLPPVWGDYFRLGQVMTNLISNAYKYTPEGGSITVGAEVRNSTEPPHIAIWVKDTGFGISEADQTRLFEKFFRAADQNIRDVPGTGLGLSITQSLVELHGGEMWFESELGRGSTFGFTIPAIIEAG